MNKKKKHNNKHLNQNPFQTRESNPGPLESQSKALPLDIRDNSTLNSLL